MPNEPKLPSLADIADVVAAAGTNVNDFFRHRINDEWLDSNVVPFLPIPGHDQPRTLREVGNFLRLPETPEEVLLEAAADIAMGPLAFIAKPGAKAAVRAGQRSLGPGRITNAFHSTQGRLPKANEPGWPIHLGTEEAAADRARHLRNTGAVDPDAFSERARIFETDIEVNKTVGDFDLPLSDTMDEGLEHPALRNRLLDRGYDTVIYRNFAEDPGSASVTVLNSNKQLRPRTTQVARREDDFRRMMRGVYGPSTENRLPYQSNLPFDEVVESAPGAIRQELRNAQPGSIPQFNVRTGSPGVEDIDHVLDIIGFPKDAALRHEARSTFPTHGGPSNAASKFDHLMNQHIPPTGEQLERLAYAQRGWPERAMLDVQKFEGGGVVGFVAEHGGDIMHRMNQFMRTTPGEEGIEWGRTYVLEKTTKVLRTLDNPYGFRREAADNAAAAARIKGIATDTQEGGLAHELREYARRHADLPVYNRPQRLARDAAVAFGNKKYPKAAELYRELHELALDRDLYRESFLNWGDIGDYVE